MGLLGSVYGLGSTADTQGKRQTMVVKMYVI